MTPHENRPGGLLRDLDQDECWAHLDSSVFGRIAYVDRDGPIILPLNYVAHEGVIWLRTASYNQLAIHAAGQHVAFEIDHADEHDHTGWSVLARGIAEHVVGGRPDVEGVSTSPVPWPDGIRSMTLRLTPTSVSGRALRQRDVTPEAGHGPGTIQRAGTSRGATSRRA